MLNKKANHRRSCDKFQYKYVFCNDGSLTYSVVKCHNCQRNVSSVATSCFSLWIFDIQYCQMSQLTKECLLTSNEFLIMPSCVYVLFFPNQIHIALSLKQGGKLPIGRKNHIMPSMAMYVRQSTFASVKFLLQLKTYLGSVMYAIFLGLKVHMLHKTYNFITSRLNQLTMKSNSDIT